MERPTLSRAELTFLAEARRAVLATRTAEGHARLVPVCFVVGEGHDDEGRVVIFSPLDEKPKSSADPHALARVRDLLVRPEVTLLVDRWSEDWTQLGWLRCEGTARLLEPTTGTAAEHSRAVSALRAKYPDYRAHALETRPMIRIVVERAVTWGNLSIARLPRI